VKVTREETQMDPNETLRIIRALVRQLEIEDPGPPQEAPIFVQHARDLTEHVSALDEWITKGGFAPAAWRGPMPDFVYMPTREKVEILHIANEGQQQPEDPGHGERLYAVRFPNGSTGQAAAWELGSVVDGKPRPFRREDYRHH
jgi:hypothetical protein